MLHKTQLLILASVIALATLHSESNNELLTIQDNNMQKTILSAAKKTLVGICIRTNNVNEIDFTKPEAKIFPCVRRYFHEQIGATIPNRSNPGTTLCAYTEYESDHTGDYTYFIGEEVTSINQEALPAGLSILEIPAQSYVKFTTQPGDLPGVLRNAWFNIWNMKDSDLGGKRSYKVDYEVYDERSATPDHHGIVLDILIGIEQA